MLFRSELEFLPRSFHVDHRRQIGSFLVDPVEHSNTARPEHRYTRALQKKRDLLCISSKYALDADEEKDIYDTGRRMVLGKNPDSRFVHQGQENQELANRRKKEKLFRKGWNAKRDRRARDKDRGLIHELPMGDRWGVSEARPRMNKVDISPTCHRG